MAMAKIDWRPELYIDVKPIEDEALANSIYAETQKYSITPTTFKSRKFFSEAKEAFWYKDQYQYLQSEVHRYGINSANINSKTISDERLAYSGEAEVSASAEVKSESSARSSRGGGKIKPEDIKLLEHHTIEVLVFQKALEHLLENGSNRTTVLVDIFARESGSGVITMLPDGHPEIHTVLLYKNPEIKGKHEVLVIDPSNFTYSNHLSNDSMRLQLKHMRQPLAQDPLDKVVTSFAKDQIYKAPRGKAGSDQDQYRDCIDIAVKLAFGLNAMAQTNPQLRVKPEDIVKLDAIKAISSLQVIDSSFAEANAAVRIKQTSDLRLVETFNKTAKAIDKGLGMCNGFSNEIYAPMLAEYHDVLKTHNSGKLVLNKLLQYHIKLGKQLQLELTKDQEELLSLIQVLPELPLEQGDVVDLVAELPADD